MVWDKTVEMGLAVGNGQESIETAIVFWLMFHSQIRLKGTLAGSPFFSKNQCFPYFLMQFF